METIWSTVIAGLVLGAFTLQIIWAYRHPDGYAFFGLIFVMLFGCATLTFAMLYIVYTPFDAISVADLMAKFPDSDASRWIDDVRDIAEPFPYYLKATGSFLFLFIYGMACLFAPELTRTLQNTRAGQADDEDSQTTDA